MPLTINVHKNPLGDCTNGGISQADRLTIMNVEGPCKPSDDAPAAWMLVRSENPYHDVIVVPCNPAGDAPTTEWVMAGGNCVMAIDSRLRDAFRDATVDAMGLDDPESREIVRARLRVRCLPIHDRIEA